MGKDVGNCGHWEYEVQYPIVPRQSAEPSREQILMPRSLDDIILMTHRNERFTRAASHRAMFRSWRIEVSFDLGRLENNQRALPIEVSSDMIPDPRVVEHHPIMVCNAQRMNLASEATEPRPLELLSSSVADSEVQRSDFVVYEDASAETEMVGSSRTGSSDLVQEELTPSGRARSEPQHILNADGYANENWNPLALWNGSGINERRSPLPEWFPRSPLQDITNILASGMVRSCSCPVYGCRFVRSMLHMNGMSTFQMSMSLTNIH